MSKPPRPLGLRPSSLPFHYSVLAGVILAVAVGGAQAASEALDGESHTVVEGDDEVSWTLSNGAELEVQEGAETRDIYAQDSTVIITGGSIDSTYNSLAGVSLTRSNATISGADIKSNGAGIAVDNVNCSGDNCGSVSVSDSYINAGTGLSAGVGADLTLSATEVVTERADSNSKTAAALLQVGGTVRITEGSSLTGTYVGALLRDGYGQQASLLIDDSHLESVNGSAILVEANNPGDAAGNGDPSTFDVMIANGSTVTAGNGVLLEVKTASSVNLVIDDSQLSGDVQANAQSTVAVLLQNGASLSGQLQDVASLTVLASDFSGSLHSDGRDTSLQLADGATANADAADGVLLAVNDGNAELIVDHATATGDVRTDGDSNLALYLQNAAQFNGQVSVNSGNNLLLVDASAFNGSVSSAGGSTDLQLQNQARFDGRLSVTGGEASLAVTGGSTATGSDGVLLDVSAGDAQLIVDASQASGDILASGGSTAVYLQNGAQLDGRMQVTGGENQLVVASGATLGSGSAARANDAFSAGPLLDVQGGSAELTVDNATVNGDVTVGADGSASVTLQNFGVLTGQLNNVSQLDVNSGATWNLVGDASVANVAMQGGTIDFGDGSTGFRTLSLGTLSGNGTFAMNTDIAAGQGDLLNVEGEASGNHMLSIRNTGAEVDDASLQVVHTGGGDAQFGVVGGAVDVGTYEYQLAQHGNDWFLEATREVTPSTASVLGLFSAAPSVWYGELSSLRSRMGELRNGQQGGGVWARTYANRYKLSAADAVDYDQNQSGLSVGADGQLPTASGQWLLGVLAGTSTSNLDLGRGTSGDIDSYYVGLYTTWLADNGYYLDAVLKANRFDNSSDVRMSDGTKAKGDYKNNGIGLSVEAGRHIALQDDWFVEPYAQVAALWVDGDDYHLDNGMQAQSNHANSMLGKLGSSLGKRIALPSGGFVEPYAKLAVTHEFADNNRVKVNDDRFVNDLSGTRGEIGGGVALQVSDRLQMHLDLDYSKGESVEQPYGVNLGVRYNF